MPPSPSSSAQNANGANAHGGDAAPLSIEECRQLLGWKNASDKEVEEFLGSLRNYLSRFLDDYFKEEFAVDEPE